MKNECGMNASRSTDCSDVAGSPEQGTQAAVRNPGSCALPESLVITPIARRPLKLPEATVRAVLQAEIAAAGHAAPDSRAPVTPIRASVVVVTFNNLTVTRLC